jgi:hypothetical protein
VAPGECVVPVGPAALNHAADAFRSVSSPDGIHAATVDAP